MNSKKYTDIYIMRPTEFSKNKTKRNRNKKFGGVLRETREINNQPKLEPKREPTDKEIVVSEVNNFFTTHNGNKGDGIINYDPIPYETFLEKNEDKKGNDILEKFKEITGNIKKHITKELFQKYVENKIKFQNILIKLFANIYFNKLNTSITEVMKNKVKQEKTPISYHTYTRYFGIPVNSNNSSNCRNDFLYSENYNTKYNELDDIYLSIAHKTSNNMFFAAFSNYFNNNPIEFNKIKKYDINTEIYDDEDEDEDEDDDEDESLRNAIVTEPISSNVGGTRTRTNEDTTSKRGRKNKSKKQIGKRKSNKKKSNKKRSNKKR